MALAHQIGEDRCQIYSQDISQKSSKMLRLNLILNNLVGSIQNIIQGDTLVSPKHKEANGSLRKFDYIVSNPPFKLDFSDDRDTIAEDTLRFWAGVPEIPKKDKKGMGIYLCFLQHIIYSLKEGGKAAIVVPTGFITSKQKIEKNILKKLVDGRMLSGVVSMPSNIFANTGTNVSVIFVDRTNTDGKVVLMDASKLGTTIKDDGIQKTLLSEADIDKIITTFHAKEPVEDFAVAVSYEDIVEKNYSLSAGQYFDIKIDYVDITEEEFNQRMNNYKQMLTEQFAESHRLEEEIMAQLDTLKFNE
jgi:type I restriction enzyme M protein